MNSCPGTFSHRPAGRSWAARFGPVGWLLSLLLVLGACDNTSPQAPRSYDGDWLGFSYPGHWQVSEQDDGDLLVVEGPAGARFSIHVRSDPGDTDIEAFARQYRRGQGAEVSLMPVERPSRIGRLRGFREDLVVDGVPMAREFLSISRNDEIAYLVSEVPQSARYSAQTGFDLIFTTFAFR